MAFKNYYGKTVSAEATSGEVTFDDLNGVLSIYERKRYSGYINSAGNWTYVNNERHDMEFVIIAVNGGEKISHGPYVLPAGVDTRIVAVSEYPNPVNNEPAGLVSLVGNTSTDATIPDGAKYLVVQIMYDGVESKYGKLLLDNIDFAKTAREELRSEKFDNGVNWVAFGDSITQKYYSYFNEDGTVTTKENGWSVVYLNAVANKNHWNVTNKGYGGMGWIMTSTGADTYIAYNRIKEIDFTQYNLVTFAYGINDWKGNKPMGSLYDEFVYDEAMTPATVIESMRYCFEYIMSKNPNIKIVVITPLNCRGYSYNFGDDSTCWARGYTGFSNTGTLDEFTDKMIEVCDSYGIECIDMTRNSCINKANIVQMLPDGVHPSAECHEMIGIELAKKINFC